MREDELVRFVKTTTPQPPSGFLPPPTDGLEMPDRIYALGVMAVGTCMAVLDSTIANVALPTFVRAFAIAPAMSIWIVNAFQLAVVATLLPLSALGDKITYRRVYKGGLIVFTLGSFLCAISQNFPELLAARILQGLGAGGILSIGPALTRFIFPQRLLGQAIGITSLVVATSSALGPTIGGFILSLAPWPWIFAINVPIGALNIFMALRYLPPTLVRDKRIDLISVIASAAGLALAVFGLDALSRHVDVATARIAAAVGIVLIAFFVVRQRRIDNPLVAPELFASQRFSLAALTSLVSFIAQGLALVSLPFLFREELHASPLHIGMLLSTWPITIAVIGPLAGRLSDRVPPPVLSTIGLAILALGLYLQGALPSAHASVGAIVLRSVLCGLGFGFFQPPNNREILGNAPRHLMGNASGMLATVRVLGQTCGAAAAAVMLATGGSVDRGAHTGLLFAASIAAAAVVVSATRLRPSVLAKL